MIFNNPKKKKQINNTDSFSLSSPDDEIDNAARFFTTFDFFLIGDRSEVGDDGTARLEFFPWFLSFKDSFFLILLFKFSLSESDDNFEWASKCPYDGTLIVDLN